MLVVGVIGKISHRAGSFIMVSQSAYFNFFSGIAHNPRIKAHFPIYKRLQTLTNAT